VSRIITACLAFSPCKSFLAYGSWAQNVVHVWDRHGGQAWLEGHTSRVTCLKYMLDGRYLASGSGDKSIRVLRVTSESGAHPRSSDESRYRGSDIILLGHSTTSSTGLKAFGRELRLWLFHGPTRIYWYRDPLLERPSYGDVITNQVVSIHTFDPLLAHPRGIDTLFSSPGDDNQ
jgi:WD40 repeat protein